MGSVISRMTNNYVRTFSPDDLIPRSSGPENHVHEVNYLWEIEDEDIDDEYSDGDCKLRTVTKWADGKPLKSEIFNSATDDGCKWYLEFYPNGKSGVPGKPFLSLQLDPTSKRTTVFADFNVSVFLRDPDDLLKQESWYKSYVVRKFEVESHQGCGFPNVIGKHAGSHYVDSVFVYCEIKYFLGSADPWARVVTKSSLSDDFGGLLKNERFTDVVLSVKGKEFKAHKLILSARSPFFAAMFNLESMKKLEQNKIEITDFEESVVEEVLNYIYTDETKNLENMASELLVAADVYGLDGLKNMCEKTLVQKLSIENAVDILIFADIHRASELKSSTVNYIVSKSKEVMKTTAWKNIAPSHSHLLMEICEGFSDQ